MSSSTLETRVKKCWQAIWYDSEGNYHKKFTGQSFFPPKKAARQHYRSLLQIGRTCSDGALLDQEYTFDWENAYEVPNTEANNNQAAYDMRGLVRVHTDSLGHSANFKGLARLADKAPTILEGFKNDPNMAHQLNDNKDWNNTPKTVALSTSEGVALREKLRGSQALGPAPSFKPEQLVDALLDLPNKSQRDLQIAHGVPQATISLWNCHLKKEEIRPTTKEGMKQFVERIRTAGKIKLSESNKKKSLKHQLEDKDKTISELKKENEQLKAKIRKLEK